MLLVWWQILPGECSLEYLLEKTLSVTFVINNQNYSKQCYLQHTLWAHKITLNSHWPNDYYILTEYPKSHQTYIDRIAHEDRSLWCYAVHLNLPSTIVMQWSLHWCVHTVLQSNHTVYHLLLSQQGSSDKYCSDRHPYQKLCLGL